MNKKLLITALSLAFATSSALAIASCDLPFGETEQQPNQIEQIYEQYVVHAKAEGQTPLSYEEWFATIKGEKGEQGIQGEKGEKGDKGDQGIQGEKGEDGKSAYEIWLDNGYSGTEEDFLNWLKAGTDGTGIVHKFGNWIETTKSGTSCADKIFYRVCSVCNEMQWKHGSSKSHVWATEYTTDGSFHWYDCENCDEVKDKAEHIPNESNECTSCGESLGATVGVVYDLSSDGTYAEVIDYEGTAKKVRIADTYQGVPVTNIYNAAFYNNDTITSVIIPDSVITIGNQAFDDCQLLESVTIGNSVKTIGELAFGGCTSLTSVTIGNSVTTIGSHAFYCCTNLTSVTIPDSVTIIDYSAFYSCDRLTNVTIPNSVTTIGNQAFAGCNNLTSVTIPDSVTTIGELAFASCSNLKFTEYGNCKYLGNAENPYFALIETSNTNYSSYTIHNSTKIIAGRAFFNCSRMSNITIPDSVITIGTSAFAYCGSLTSVIIGNSVTTISYYAFQNCTSLISVTIENTEGWSADGTSISATDLADTSTAATYLKYTYYWYYWKRS